MFFTNTKNYEEPEKSLLSLLLCLSWLLSFAACASQSDLPEESSDAGTAASVQTEAEAAAPDFFGPDSGYVMVRGETALKKELDEFLRFKNAVRSICPDMELTTDWLAAGKEPPEKEILFGNTGRPETAEALSMIQGAGFIICVLHGKLVIAATSDRALGSAVTCFTDTVLSQNTVLSEGYILTGGETVPIPQVTLNQIPLSEFTVIADNTKTWELPIYTLTDFFARYCGITLKAAAASKAGEGHKIILGGTRPDGSKYEKFETELYFQNGNLHLGCANATMAQKIIYTLIDQYLDRPGTAELTFPEGQALHASAEGDNWDSADPKDFLSVQDRVVRSCYKLQAILEWDMARGIYYTYENKGYKSTISAARETGIRCTNCVILGNWAMKDAGFYSSGIYNHTYDGKFGYTFTSGAATFFADSFDVIDMRSRNVSISSLLSAGELLPGDIISYKDHNQTILPLGYAMDGGHGNCMSSGAGAKFSRFVGPNPCKSTVVGYVFRAKDAQ